MPDPEEQSAVEFKTFTITVETPDGKLPPATINVPEVPLGLADLAPLAFGLEDGIVGLAVRTRCDRDARRRAGVAAGRAVARWCRFPLRKQFTLWKPCFPGPIIRPPFLCGASPKSARSLTKAVCGKGSGASTRPRTSRPLRRNTGAPGAMSVPPRGFVFHSFVASLPCREYTVTSEPSLCSQLLSARVERIKIHKR